MRIALCTGNGWNSIDSPRDYFLPGESGFDVERRYVGTVNTVRMQVRDPYTCDLETLMDALERMEKAAGRVSLRFVTYLSSNDEYRHLIAEGYSSPFANGRTRKNAVIAAICSLAGIVQMKETEDAD